MPLRQFLGKHAVATVFEMGWSNFSNGEPLAAAEAEGFEPMVTTDANLRYQQNLNGRKIAIVVLLSTSWPKIRTKSEILSAAVDGALGGSYREIQADVGLSG